MPPCVSTYTAESAKGAAILGELGVHLSQAKDHVVEVEALISCRTAFKMQVQQMCEETGKTSEELLIDVVMTLKTQERDKEEVAAEEAKKVAELREQLESLKSEKADAVEHCRFAIEQAKAAEEKKEDQITRMKTVEQSFNKEERLRLKQVDNMTTYIQNLMAKYIRAIKDKESYALLLKNFVVRTWVHTLRLQQVMHSCLKVVTRLTHDARIISGDTEHLSVQVLSEDDRLENTEKLLQETFNKGVGKRDKIAAVLLDLIGQLDVANRSLYANHHETKSKMEAFFSRNLELSDKNQILTHKIDRLTEKKNQLQQKCASQIALIRRYTSTLQRHSLLPGTNQDLLNKPEVKVRGSVATALLKISQDVLEDEDEEIEPDYQAEWKENENNRQRASFSKKSIKPLRRDSLSRSQTTSQLPSLKRIPLHHPRPRTCVTAGQSLEQHNPLSHSYNEQNRPHTSFPSNAKDQIWLSMHKERCGKQTSIYKSGAASKQTQARLEKRRLKRSNEAPWRNGEKLDYSTHTFPVSTPFDLLETRLFEGGMKYKVEVPSDGDFARQIF